MNPIDTPAGALALRAAGAAAPPTVPARIGRRPLALISLFLVPLAIVGHGLVPMRLRRERPYAPAATLTA